VYLIHSIFFLICQKFNTMNHIWYTYTMSYISTAKTIESSRLSFSVVLETENLGMAGIDDLRDTLESLRRQTYPITRAHEVLVVAAGHVSDETVRILQVEYPWVKLHREPQKLEYLESKKRGAECATGGIVLFADSDVVYEDTWLERSLVGFLEAPGAAIVAGDTRIRGTSVYAMAIQLVWMMNAEKTMSHPIPIRHFDLNNFAIKKDVFLSAPMFTGLPLYRAHTVEMRKQLYAKGYSAVRVSGTRGYHLPPGSLADAWYRLLVYGSDAVAKTDFVFEYGGTVSKRFSLFRRIVRIPTFLTWKIYILLTRISVLVREDWKRIGSILLALPLAFLFLCIILVGSITGLFYPTLLFRIITEREADHVV
jgi:glycosyltransferase involved in cell wall biosynthesis